MSPKIIKVAIQSTPVPGTKNPAHSIAGEWHYPGGNYPESDIIQNVYYFMYTIPT